MHTEDDPLHVAVLVMARGGAHHELNPVLPLQLMLLTPHTNTTWSNRQILAPSWSMKSFLGTPISQLNLVTPEMIP